MLLPVDGIDTWSTESELGYVNSLNPSNECGKYNNAYIVYNPVLKARRDPQIPSQNQKYNTGFTDIHWIYHLRVSSTKQLGYTITYPIIWDHLSIHQNKKLEVKTWVKANIAVKP